MTHTEVDMSLIDCNRKSISNLPAGSSVKMAGGRNVGLGD